MAQLKHSIRFNIPWDEKTDDGRQLMCRLDCPAGTDRRRVRRELRKVFLAMGERQYIRAIREMGFSKYA